MLRKSPASDNWAEIFKNADSSSSSSKVTNRINFRFFPIYNSFVSPLLRKRRLLLGLNLIK